MLTAVLPFALFSFFINWSFTFELRHLLVFYLGFLLTITSLSLLYSSEICVYIYLHKEVKKFVSYLFKFYAIFYYLQKHQISFTDFMRF